MTPEQREKIHDELRTMLAAHKSARWLLEDVMAAMLKAMDGEPLDAGKIRETMDQYAHAVEAVRYDALWAFNEIQKVTR